MATTAPTRSSARFYKAAVAQGLMTEADARRCLAAIAKAARPIDPARVAIQLGALTPEAARRVRAGVARPAAAAPRRDGRLSLLLVGGALLAGTLTGIAAVVALRAPVAEVEVGSAETPVPAPEAATVAFEVEPAAEPAPAPSPPPPVTTVAPEPRRERPAPVVQAPAREEVPAPTWREDVLAPVARGPVKLPDVTRPAAGARPATANPADGAPDDAAPGDDGFDPSRGPGTLEAPSTGHGREADAGDLPGSGAPAAEPAVDTTSPVAAALRDLLHVSYTLHDGRVEAGYDFSEQGQAADFLTAGFDKAEINPVNGSHAYATDLELGVGSRGLGRLAHVLPLTGDVQVEFTLWLNHSTTRSNLVFMLGDHVGVRWGQQLVKVSRSGAMRPLTRGEPDRSIFRGERKVQVKLTRAGDTLGVEVDGRRVAQKTFKPGELDGRFGLIASDLRVIITDLRIHGVVDASRL